MLPHVLLLLSHGLGGTPDAHKISLAPELMSKLCSFADALMRAATGLHAPLSADS